MGSRVVKPSQLGLVRSPLKNFTWREFECRGSGGLWWPETGQEKVFFWETIASTQAVRDEVGFPLVVRSGHRSLMHNLSIGGALRSMHLRLAVDLAPPAPLFPGLGTYAAALTALQAAMKKYFGSVGLYKTFVHGDQRHILGKPTAFWDERHTDWTPDTSKTE